MNTDVQDPVPAGPRAALGSHSAMTGSSADGPPGAGAGSTVRRAPWPRWLFPVVAAAAVVLGLVVIGIVPLSTVLYAGLFGAMILMHVGGHGHGGHGHGGHGHENAAGREVARSHEAAGERSDEADLREPSADAQRRPIRSTRALDRRAAHASGETNGETNDDGEHPAGCCH